MWGERKSATLVLIENAWVDYKVVVPRGDVYNSSRIYAVLFEPAVYGGILSSLSGVLEVKRLAFRE